MGERTPQASFTKSVLNVKEERTGAQKLGRLTQTFAHTPLLLLVRHVPKLRRPASITLQSRYSRRASPRVGYKVGIQTRRVNRGAFECLLYTACVPRR